MSPLSVGVLVCDFWTPFSAVVILCRHLRRDLVLPVSIYGVTSAAGRPCLAGVACCCCVVWVSTRSGVGLLWMNERAKGE